jgi:putative ABC transport system permease protein
MILKIAWRNIWRSKVRSFIVLTSIAIGIWAGLLIIGFSFGMNNERTAAAIGSTLGHSQVHSEAFLEEPTSAATIGDAEAVAALQDSLLSAPYVTGVSVRGVMMGMVSAPKSARGARMIAVDPESERENSTFPSTIIEGDFFETKTRNSVVIGAQLAEKLGVGLRKKVVLTFQDGEGNISRASFRITGIYRTLNSTWDELNIYIKRSDLKKTIGKDLVHELMVRYDETEGTEEKTAELAQMLPQGLQILSWKRNSPELGYADDMMGIMLVLVLGIIMMALLFGIVNNMLMAILERRRELGMLMAVGMNKRKLFVMILVETLMLGFVGGPIGIVLGDLSTRVMMGIGIDLTSKKEGLANLGVQSVIYPEIVPEYYIIVAIMVVLTALIAALYPAFKALKLNPVQAIRGE